MILTLFRFSAVPAFLSALVAVLAGCATGHPPVRAERNATHSASAAATTSPSASASAAASAHSQMVSGIDAYNAGEYGSAIKRLNAASDPGRSDRATQLEAIKYLAFSYCVSGQTTQCRLQFERALRIDPAFDLAAGEKGHPLWGPVFERARQNRSQ